MSSMIFFRMHHGRQSEQIAFDGPGMRLLDLKKSILEKKKIGGSLDFDLKVNDENEPDKGKWLLRISSECFQTFLICLLCSLCR